MTATSNARRRYARHVDAGREDRLREAAEHLAYEHFALTDRYGLTRSTVAWDAWEAGEFDRWDIDPDEMDEVLSLAHLTLRLANRR